MASRISPTSEPVCKSGVAVGVGVTVVTGGCVGDGVVVAVSVGKGVSVGSGVGEGVFVGNRVGVAVGKLVGDGVAVGAGSSQMLFQRVILGSTVPTFVLGKKPGCSAITGIWPTGRLSIL